jgi:hypothetical protein
MEKPTSKKDTAPYYQFLSLSAQEIPQKEIASILKVSPATICRWKHHGCPKDEGRPYRIDYGPIDKLLNKGVTVRRICRECHVGESTVIKRRLWLRAGCPQEIPYIPENTLDRPFVPLPDRIERKRRNMHLSKQDFAVWILGPAGHQFMHEQRGIPA